jgi:nitrate/TMAO reductase-like tetraheme cytochrome c subunit
MAEASQNKSPYKVLFIVIGVIVVLLIAMSASMAVTSKTAFCISCHEIAKYKDELDKSPHAFDKDKNPIECKQCHIPNSIGPKYLIVKSLGLKDLFVHNFGDPDNLNRREMQNNARRFMLDENCLVCHRDLMKDAKDKAISEIGKLSHEAYLDKTGTRRNCIGCHFNMAHLPEFDRRFPFNAEFAKRLPLQKEEQK